MRLLFSNFINGPLRRLLLVSNKTALSSQTLYCTLLGLIELSGSKSHSLNWKDETSKVAQLIRQSQCSDGGFDIGYEFSFGKYIHGSKESTAPELVALLALVLFSRLHQHASPDKATLDAISWIRRNAIILPDGSRAIPYAPHSCPEAYIVNGTSFAMGALGVFIGTFPHQADDGLIDIYRGFGGYLSSRLVSDLQKEYAFWPYYDQTSKNLPNEPLCSKVDIYHIAQQIIVHRYAERLAPVDLQSQFLTSVSRFLLGQVNDDGTVPYTLHNHNPENIRIHTWGLASCIPALLMCYEDTADFDYFDKAQRIYKWLKKNAWHSDHFFPVLKPTGQPVDTNYYPRSDAWIFWAFAKYFKCTNDSTAYEILEHSYLKLLQSNFRGRDNHIRSNGRLLYRRVRELVVKP